MMNRKRFVGTFRSIDAVLYKVVELKAQGYSENELYAFSCEPDNISMLRDQSRMELHGAYGMNWHRGLNELLGIDESIRNAFKEIGFSDEDSAHYYDEVENGGVALFVDNNTDSERSENMDSRAELGRSGEILDGQDGDQPSLTSDDTTPRVKTENL